jgi:hypothetical protein
MDPISLLEENVTDLSEQTKTKEKHKGTPDLLRPTSTRVTRLIQFHHFSDSSHSSEDLKTINVKKQRLKKRTNDTAHESSFIKSYAVVPDSQKAQPVCDKFLGRKKESRSSLLHYNSKGKRKKDDTAQSLTSDDAIARMIQKNEQILQNHSINFTKSAAKRLY